MADDISKGNFYKAVVEVMGYKTIVEGFTFHRLPHSLKAWIANPTVDDDLADKILKDISVQQGAPQIMGYNTR